MINLTVPMDLIEECNALADRVNGRSEGRSNAERADTSRRLNYLADRLDLAAALVRQEYWSHREEKSA